MSESTGKRSEGGGIAGRSRIAALLVFAFVAACGQDQRADVGAAGDTAAAAVAAADTAPAPATPAATPSPASAAPPPEPSDPAGDTAGQPPARPAARTPAQPAPAPAARDPAAAAPSPAPAGQQPAAPVEPDTAPTPPQTVQQPSPAAQDTAPATAAQDAPLRDEYHQAPKDTVDQAVYDGWKQYNLNCARCHGEDVLGSTIAPHLITSVKPNGPINTQEAFIQVVCAGRPDKGMPAWCPLGLEMEKINQIYSYVKGRSDGEIGPGRPALRQGG